ncbi:MAG: Lactate dehydrogenase and related dehydrogenase [Candidatus Magasanikbacteria bacterium GW2011_GWC2_45_8]|uniref:Lactate dehydrogenase and related dehydrogenase n=1 Tax=Candidatus Magasanikbacteria bacterium GW2011_GWC2_45_8 TaxID=1619050 RepID=A0A0G1N133_9BACT|nr:MAG: Lactate dehydrogenase and related dehydrogenase [Candidatus Magasanikbacteria bacterium GW2011_GWC2_45_8]
MSSFSIFVSRCIPDAGLSLLKKQGYKVKVSPHDRVLTKGELLREMKDIDALLCLLTDKIDGEIMDAGSPRLKIIANYAVGFDNIDLKAAATRAGDYRISRGVYRNAYVGFGTARGRGGTVYSCA